MNKWIRVVIPAALVVVWLAIAGIGGPYFGKIEEVSKIDLAAFLPASVDSTKVQNALTEYRSDKSIPAVVVFDAKDGDMSAADASKINAALASMKDIQGVAGSLSPAIVSKDGKAALATIQIESGVKLTPIVDKVKKQLNASDLGDYNHYITGPAGFGRDLGVAFSGIDGLLLLVALAVVFVILIAVYRSPLLPILVLLTSMVALSASILVVWNGAKAGWFELNGQVQGILFILVIGAATDYSLLLVSRFREELYRHKSRASAMWAALKGVIEPILASGGTVMVGLLCLLLSDLGSNKALGPVGSIGIAMAVLATLTFLASMLALAGRAAFWPLTPRASKESLRDHTAHLRHGLWPRVGRFVERFPRPIWIITSVFLLAAFTGIAQLKADGIQQSDFILGKSEARDGQKILNEHFPAGSGSPALVWTPATSVDAMVAKLDADPSVDSVSALAENSPSGAKPLGKNEQAVKAAVLAGVMQNPRVPAQMAATIAESAYPFRDASVKTVDGKAMLQVTLKHQPDTQQAKDAVKRIRDEARAVNSDAKVGGTTALQLDTNTTSIHDRAVIIPAVLLAITIILMILLRSILAPIVLLLTTVISFGTALGTAALVFNHILKFPGADPSVVLYGFVFLVALGIDYNIFLMTRVREEAARIGTKKGVIKGLVVTGGVITSAGVVLAATFAALAVLPIMFLVQLAFIVAFGVLLDTLIVRSLLVPALIRDAGSIIWWPSKLRNKK